MRALGVKLISAGVPFVLFLIVCAGGLAYWVTQPNVVPAVIQAPPVASAQLREIVKTLSVDLHPRSFDHKKNLDAAADYVADQMRKRGATVTFQSFDVEGGTFRNVVARFGPKEGELLVVGAHYDSHGNARGDPHHTSGHTPGADDNASGVAGLVALAGLYVNHPPRVPVELVAYALEEPPHFRTPNMGSARHAKALREANRNVALMISLEMIGTFFDEPNSQTFPVPGMDFLYPDKGNFIAVVGAFTDRASTCRVKAAMRGASALPVYSVNAPAFVSGVDFSDHLNYWNEKFPAVMITDTAFLRNEHYHLPEDTHEKLDYARMAEVVRGVWAISMQP